MRTVRHRLAAVAGVTCLLVAGCGSNPEPKPLPKSEPKTSPSASPSPSATPPVLPAAAKVKTKAGAIAFSDAFMEALNYAGTTGDTGPLRELFIPQCTRCAAIARGIDETYAAGGSIRGGEWRSTGHKFYAITNDVAVLDAKVTFEPQTLVKKAGESPTQFGKSTNNLKVFNLRWQNGRWYTSALDPEA